MIIQIVAYYFSVNQLIDNSANRRSSNTSHQHSDFAHVTLFYETQIMIHLVALVYGKIYYITYCVLLSHFSLNFLMCY